MMLSTIVIYISIKEITKLSQKFNAIIAKKNSEGKFFAELSQITSDELPDEDVLIDVDYSTLNYKDGLAVTNKLPICQKFPMVCGIDLAGSVIESKNEKFTPGQKVLVNGFGLSEKYWGGYSQKQRINSSFLVSVPENFSTRVAMAIGTAGYTAMLAVNAIRDHGVQPSDGDILVTGSVGGVGSVAVTLLSGLGYSVIASTGRMEQSDYLKNLGAKKIIDRTTLSAEGRPLDKESWVAAIDNVGSSTLSNVLAKTNYSGIVASCGLAGGSDLPATVLPFILRNIKLQGIDSVQAPLAFRERAWQDLSELLDLTVLESMTGVAKLSDVFDLGKQIVSGKIKGRSVIDVNSI